MSIQTLFDLAGELPGELKLPGRGGSSATDADHGVPAGPTVAARNKPPRPDVCATGTLLPAGGTDLDQQRIKLLVAALAPGCTDYRSIVIPVIPASKARARHGNGRTYKTKKDAAAERQTAWYLRSVFRQPITGNVALGCVFFRHDKQLIDGDNMLKHVCDAANKIVYLDDSQITAKYAVVEYDPANPRTIIVVAHHRSSMLRGTDDVSTCERCSAVFLANGRKYCSDACRWPKRAVASC